MPNALPKSGKAAACQTQCLGPFERAADPCIEQFVATQVATFLKDIGLKLPLIFQGIDFQNAARQIKKFFESDSEAFWMLPGQPELPHIRPNEDWLLPSVELTEFANLLDRVQLPNSETCRVERNLKWLGDLLHLSQVERKLLLWAYLVAQQRPNHLGTLMCSLPVSDEQSAYQMLAALLDEPEQEIADCFAIPHRLSAMGLMDGPWRGIGRAGNLAQYVLGTDAMLEILETPHRSKKAILHCLSTPDLKWDNEFDYEDEPSVCCQRYPGGVGEAIEATILDEPLTAAHIASLIWWWTGMPVETVVCAPLKGLLDYYSVHPAIRNYAQKQALRNRSITEVGVLHALYTAAL
jgi:hypothetical protein